jgi:hypothetical protein
MASTLANGRPKGLGSAQGNASLPSDVLRAVMKVFMKSSQVERV